MLSSDEFEFSFDIISTLLIHPLKPAETKSNKQFPPVKCQASLQIRAG
jgi:hypothetical protein